MIFLVLVSVVAVFVTRQTLLLALEQRTQDQLRTESDAFRELAAGVEIGQPGGLEEALAAFRDRPAAAASQRAYLFTTGEELLPVDAAEGFEIAFEQRKRWADLSEAEQGTAAAPSGPVDYLALPILAPDTEESGDDGDMQGVFVVAAFTGPQRAAIADTVKLVGLALLITLVAAAIVLWWFTDRVLLSRSSAAGYTNRPASESSSEGVPPAPEQPAPPVPSAPVGPYVREPVPEPAHTAEVPLAQSHEPDEWAPAADPVEVVHGSSSRGRVAVREHARQRIREGEKHPEAVPSGGQASQLSAPDIERTELGRLAVDAYTRAQQLADRDWVMDIPPDAVLQCDYTQVMEALTLIAAGAAARTHPGDTILISAVDRGEVAEVSMTDQVVMPAGESEPLDHAFDPDPDDAGDTGWERLRVVRAVAEAHRGQLAAEWLPGGGMVVRLVLAVGPGQRAR
jgi:hypothetical protein